MQKVLLTASHPAGGNIIGCVGKRLREENKVEVTVLGHQYSQKVLAEGNIAFRTIEDFGIHNVLVPSMEALLDQLCPNIVILGTADQAGQPVDIIEYSMTLAARKLGISTVAIMDTWMEGDESKLFTDIRDGVARELLPTYIAVIDELHFKAMVAEGFPEGRLKITGQPCFDGLLQESQDCTAAKRKEIRDWMGLNCNTLLLFSGNAFAKEKERRGYCDLDVVKIIAKTLPELGNTGVAVKLHMRTPAEDVREVRSFIDQCGVNMKFIDGVPKTLALGADLTIVEHSLVGNELVFMRLPCMSFQPGILGHDTLHVSRHAIIPRAYSEKTCKILLRRSVVPKYREDLVLQSADLTNDGQATKNVVQFIYSLL